MPFPLHTLISWSGTWSSVNAEEQWACTLRLGGAITGDDEDHQTFADAVAVIVGDFHTSNAVPSAALLQVVKANQIGPDGKYHKEGITFQVDYTTPVPGGNSVGILPLQNTVVNTLQTNRTRGIGARGRFYPPGVGLNELDTNGVLLSARQEARALRAVELVRDLNGLALAESIQGVSVVSAGANGGTGPGVAVPVTSVNVGRLVDTQRRRRASLTEDVRWVEEV